MILFKIRSHPLLGCLLDVFFKDDSKLNSTYLFKIHQDQVFLAVLKSLDRISR